MAVTAPADRRFLRAQEKTKPGRRHRPWQAWIRVCRSAALVLTAGWVTWVGLGAVAGSGALRVRSIEVNGNRRLSNGEVVALVDGLLGRNILSIDLEEWRGRLLESSWVADAIVRRALPSTVEVIVSERHPLAIGRIGEELYLVDAQGGIIDEFGPRYADLDLPILDGLVSGTAGEETDQQRAWLAARLLDALRPHPDLAARVSQLDVSDPHNAVVIVDQDTAKVRLGEDRFIERLRSYVEMAPTLRQRVAAIDYVDLRYGERWVVGSQDGRGTGEGAAAAR